MAYDLNGHFLEACDCTVICPCWIDDDPTAGHCTGLTAWELEGGSVIDGTDVSGCSVVSVTTHSGNRRDESNNTSVLYLDVPGALADAPLSDPRAAVLAEAFSGRLSGPLAGLAKVSGTVVATEAAEVRFTAPADRKAEWQVSVHPWAPAEDGGRCPDPVASVQATGAPLVFAGEQEPLTVRHTALSLEMGVPGEDEDVVVQQGKELSINVGALPGSTVEVLGRSGMRGRFHYECGER